MEIIDLLLQIDDSNHDGYRDFTKKWRRYAENSIQPSTEDWDGFFKQTNPVAGIDWACLKDVVTIRNKREVQTNERQTFINNWGSISQKIRDVSGDDATMINQLSELRNYLMNLILENGGRKMVVAINRVLVTFFPDFFIPIPDEKKVMSFIDLINEYINGVHIEKTDDWVNNNHNLKQYLDGVPEARKKEAWKVFDKLNEYHNKRQKMTIETTELLKNNYNLILTGAPGTGKTYLAREIAATMIGCEKKDLKDNEQFGFVQFHPSYDYTDFVEGLRPKDKGNGGIVFERKDGIFKAFCAKAAIAEKKKEDKKFVFVIDEINRGEISKIFGELFFSIDPGYRKPEDRVPVKTQYQNLICNGEKIKDDGGNDTDDEYLFTKGFYVPSNVYIIGTMNDIDRSVESMDFAFRRRFAFKEIWAKDRQEDILSMLSNKADAIKKMTNLNAAIERQEGFGPAYHIGPAYFKQIEKYNGDWEQLWKNHLYGVLFEYLRGVPDYNTILDKWKAEFDK